MEPASHHKDLLVWQLGDALRRAVLPLTARPAFNRDIRGRGQLKDAANSICRNIAEGFDCDTDAEFARYLEISRRSLNEVVDCIRGAYLDGIVSRDDVLPAQSLARRLKPALDRFIVYLRKSLRKGRNRHRYPGYHVAIDITAPNRFGQRDDVLKSDDAKGDKDAARSDGEAKRGDDADRAVTTRQDRDTCEAT